MPKRSHVVLVCLLTAACAHIDSPLRNRTDVSAEIDGELKSNAVRTVRAFFSALDARDTATLESMFLPDAVVVSDTGMATDVAATLRMIRTTSGPLPQGRETYNFQVRKIGKVLVVGFLNRVTFNISGKPVVRLFNETWVFARVGATLKLVRAHYSLVGPPAEHDPS